MCVMTIEGWNVVSDVVGHIVWPLLVATLIFAFRKPIYAFISDAEEAGWGSATVKRGNQRSRNLKQETAPHRDDAVEERDPVSTQHGVAASSGDPDPLVEDATPTPDRTIRFYGRIVIDRLRRSKYNTDTTSARLGAEIVGTTYADLKQAVRLIAFLVGSTSGQRGPLAGVEPTLDALSLPDDLAADIREARKLAIDVTERTAKVDGQGAADYIDSVRALIERLVEWGVSQAPKVG
ncbi:hypothetical protein ACCO44_08160 [Microbacterium maritypicum]|uniref:hypothetical protein n=1 Tax=Microbacterium maritypicum TaxID=33918 RepID=UPI003557DFDA